MTYKEMCEYFYKKYCELPISAQINKQEKTIFHLKMELAKVRKKLNELSKNKED